MDSMTADTTTVEQSGTTLDRRAALKAALGGAAAAAVVAGPSIASLGTAPAYAVSCSINGQRTTGYNVGTTGDTGGTNEVFCYGQYTASQSSASCLPRTAGTPFFPAALVAFEIEADGQAFNSAAPSVPSPTGMVRVKRTFGTAECDVVFNSIFCPVGAQTGTFTPTAVPVDGSFTPWLGGSLGCQVASPCSGPGCGSWITIDFTCCI